MPGLCLVLFSFLSVFIYCLFSVLATMDKTSIILVQVLLQICFHFGDGRYHGWSRIVMLENRHMFNFLKNSKSFPKRLSFLIPTM